MVPGNLIKYCLFKRHLVESVIWSKKNDVSVPFLIIIRPNDIQPNNPFFRMTFSIMAFGQMVKHPL